MRIFKWEMTVGNTYMADGYILANNREEAEEKIKLLKNQFNNVYEEVYLDNDICGYDGCLIDENNIVVRWER